MSERAAAPAGRRDVTSARRVVVKIGSRLLAEDPDGRTRALAAEARACRERGVELAIVSSGAIALGRVALGMAEKPRELPLLQAAAAVGQGRLMHVWQRALDGESLAAAQVLLTHEDVRDRTRYLNARHALRALLGLGAVPVINENDTVSVDEIKFGDNDRLAALVCSLVEAELLVILTDVDGLYDGDPRQPGAQLIPVVRDVDEEATQVAGGSVSGVGTGGMASKVQAAKIAGRFGVPTVVCSGRRARPVTSLLDGAEEGTLFLPHGKEARLGGRKHWIAYHLKPAGQLVVDAGAERALVEGKKSLLPSGIRAVRGRFAAGEAVAILVEAEGGAAREFARGLVSLAADEVERVRGLKTAAIAERLGYPAAAEIVHRDDLVLL